MRYEPVQVTYSDEGQGNQDLILEGIERIRAVETWSWVVTYRKGTEPKNLQVENNETDKRRWGSLGTMVAVEMKQETPTVSRSSKKNEAQTESLWTQLKRFEMEMARDTNQVSRRDFFLIFFLGGEETKKTAWNLCQAVSYERQNWRASEVDRAMQRWLRRRS